MSSRIQTLTLLVASLICACGPDDSRASAALKVLTIDTLPSLQIGLLDGDPNYTFENVVGTAHLPSGEIAVADRGADRISIFSVVGTFERRIGGRGEGPGEFRDLVGLFASSADSIAGADGELRNLLVFDSEGRYARQFSATEASGDTVFPLDSWLHGRFWVQGALTRTGRALVSAALDALPPPTNPGFRIVRVAGDGALWIQEPEITAQGKRTWLITDPAGRPASVIDLPERFDPQEIQERAITGRWRDENDVNFVRIYTMSGTGETRPLPAWLVPNTTVAEPPPPTEDEFKAMVRSGIRAMAMAQEIHYSTHHTYTSSVDSLDWQKPEGMEAHFVDANERGWTAIFTDPAFDRICAMSYGFNVPAGWSPGGVLCAPPPK